MINKRKIIYIVSILLVVLLTSVVLSQDQEGEASWYGEQFQGKTTASGERFNMNDYTAAHREYEFGTKVRVTNLENNKSVTVRINDRGPFAGGRRRIIDLSKAAFAEIANLNNGTINVRVQVIDTPRGSGIMIDNNEMPEDETLEVQDTADKNQNYTYRIQFGAFMIRENATNLARKLSNSGIYVKVYRVKYKNGNSMYKVISEKSYNRLKEAYLDKDRFQGIGYEDCFVVKLNF